MVRDVIRASADADDIRMTPEIWGATMELHTFLFKTVYTNPVAKGEERKAQQLVGYFYELFVDRPEELPEQYLAIARAEGASRAAADYVASMTDNYCVREYTRRMIPESWQVL